MIATGKIKCVKVSSRDSFMHSVIQTFQNNKRVLFIHRFIGQFRKYRQPEMEQVKTH